MATCPASPPEFTPAPPAVARADQCGRRRASGSGAAADGAAGGELGIGAIKRAMLLRREEQDHRHHIMLEERRSADVIVATLVAVVLDGHHKNKAATARSSFEETEAGERDYIHAEEVVFRNQFHLVHVKVVAKLTAQDRETELRGRIAQEETREWLRMELKYQRSCLEPSLMEGLAAGIQRDNDAQAGVAEEEAIGRAVLDIEEITSREAIARRCIADEYRPLPFILLAMLHRRSVRVLAAEEAAAYDRIRDHFTLALQLITWRLEKMEAVVRDGVEGQATATFWTLYQSFLAAPEATEAAPAPQEREQPPRPQARRKSLQLLKESVQQPSDDAGSGDGLAMLPSGATPPAQPARSPAKVAVDSPPPPPPSTLGPIIRRYQWDDTYPYAGSSFDAAVDALARRRGGVMAAWFAAQGACGGLDLLGLARYSTVGRKEKGEGADGTTDTRDDAGGKPRRKSIQLLQEAAEDAGFKGSADGLELLGNVLESATAADGAPDGTAQHGTQVGSQARRRSLALLKDSTAGASAQEGLAMLEDDDDDDDGEGDVAPAGATPTPTPPPSTSLRSGVAGSGALRHKQAALPHIPRHPSLRAVEGLRRDRQGFALAAGRTGSAGSRGGVSASVVSSRGSTPITTPVAVTPQTPVLLPALGGAGAGAEAPARRESMPAPAAGGQLTTLLIAGIAGQAATWQQSRMNYAMSLPAAASPRRPRPAATHTRRKSLQLLKQSVGEGSGGGGGGDGAEDDAEGLAMLPSGMTPPSEPAAPPPSPPPPARVVDVDVPPPPFVLLVQVLQEREAVGRKVCDLDVTYDFPSIQHTVAREWYKCRLRSRYRRTPEEIAYSVHAIEAEAKRAARWTSFESASEALLLEAEDAFYTEFEAFARVLQKECRVGLQFLQHLNAAGVVVLAALQGVQKEAYFAKAALQRAAETWNISTFPQWVQPENPSPPRARGEAAAEGAAADNEENPPARTGSRRKSLQMLKEAVAGVPQEGLAMLPTDDDP